MSSIVFREIMPDEVELFARKFGLTSFGGQEPVFLAYSVVYLVA
jgi:hypothetical protein